MYESLERHFIPVKRLNESQVYFYYNGNLYLKFDPACIENVRNMKANFIDTAGYNTPLRYEEDTYYMRVSPKCISQFELLTEYEVVEKGPDKMVYVYETYSEHILACKFEINNEERSLLLTSKLESNPYGNAWHNVSAWYLDTLDSIYLRKCFESLEKEFDKLIFGHKLADGEEANTILKLDDKASLGIRVGNKKLASAKGKNFKLYVPYKGHDISLRISINK